MRSTADPRRGDPVAIAWPASAEAARRRGSGIHQGIYIYGAPGLVQIPIDDDTDAGFNLTIGGGVQGAVWRSLFLGGELDFDLNFSRIQR